MAKAIALNARMELRGDMNRVLAALRGATRETIKEAVDVVAEEAKRRVPVRSGHLQRSIKGKVRKARGEDLLIGNVSTNTRGTKTETRRGKVITRKVTYGYGADVEVGRAGKYKSTPYLRPALQAKINEIQEILKREAKKRESIR